MIHFCSFNAIYSILSKTELECPICYFHGIERHTEECAGDVPLKKGISLAQKLEAIEIPVLEKLWKDMFNEKNS